MLQTFETLQPCKNTRRNGGVSTKPKCRTKPWRWAIKTPPPRILVGSAWFRQYRGVAPLGCQARLSAGGGGLTDFAAEVRGKDFDGAAHFVKAGTHACADAVFE